MPEKNNQAVILVDLKSYPLEAVYTAAFSFLDKAYIYLESFSKSRIRVTLKGKEGLPKEESATLKDEFSNELLNSALRNQISKNNRKIREYLVGAAISSALKEPPQRPLVPEGGRVQTPLREENLSEMTVPWRSPSQDYGKKLLERRKKSIWERDRLGIAIPWEEKHKVKKQRKKSK